MKDIRIGDLRQRIMVEAVSLTGDGGGGVDESWLPVADVWAAVLPLSGSERVEADAISGRLSHEVWMRFRDDVGPDMRFRMGSRVFDIRVVMNIEERQRFLRLFAEERDL